MDHSRRRTRTTKLLSVLALVAVVVIPAAYPATTASTPAQGDAASAAAAVPRDEADAILQSLETFEQGQRLFFDGSEVVLDRRIFQVRRVEVGDGELQLGALVAEFEVDDEEQALLGTRALEGDYVITYEGDVVYVDDGIGENRGSPNSAVIRRSRWWIDVPENGTPTRTRRDPPTDTVTAVRNDTLTATRTATPEPDTPTATDTFTPTATRTISPEPDTPTASPEPDTPTASPEPDTPTVTPEPDTFAVTPEPGTPTATPPPLVARLDVSSTQAVPGELVVLDARNSTSAEGDLEECVFRIAYTGEDPFVRTKSNPACVEVFSFDRVGEYTATVRVTDSRGNRDTATRRLVVDRNRAPTAAFTHDPTDPEVGERVTFDASASIDPDDDIERYVWRFGDGTPPVRSRTPVLTHAYGSPGEYAVRLVVRDAAGATDTAVGRVTVSEVAEDEEFVPRFTYTPARPVTGRTVRFDATASAIPGDGPAIFRWDLDGDAVIDAVTVGPETGYTYDRPGEYEASLTIVASTGAERGIVRTVEVSAPPVARFEYGAESIVTGRPVRFDAASSADPDGEIVAYEWDFDGDGRSDETGAVVTHTFDTPGSATVRLLVIDDDGLETETVLRFDVAPAPVEGTPLVVVSGVATFVVVAYGITSGAFAVFLGKRPVNGSPSGGVGTVRSRNPDGSEGKENDDGKDREDEEAKPIDVEVHVRNSDDDDLNEEYIVLRNEGGEPYDLGGGTVSDGDGNTYPLPLGTELTPGETLTIYSGEGTDGDDELYLGVTETVWDRTTDRVVVRGADGRPVVTGYYD